MSKPMYRLVDGKGQSWSMGILFVWEWRVEKLQSGR